MYLAVKAACDAKPAVWQRSATFTDAYADFCECIEKMLRSPAKDASVNLQVADTILTTDMDELIEQFEAVDVAFVDDYTAARSMDVTA